MTNQDNIYISIGRYIALLYASKKYKEINNTSIKFIDKRGNFYFALNPAPAPVPTDVSTFQEFQEDITKLNMYKQYNSLIAKYINLNKNTELIFFHILLYIL